MLILLGEFLVKENSMHYNLQVNNFKLYKKFIQNK